MSHASDILKWATLAMNASEELDSAFDRYRNEDPENGPRTLIEAEILNVVTQCSIISQFASGVAARLLGDFVEEKEQLAGEAK
jgi:hypothetical protein